LGAPPRRHAGQVGIGRDNEKCPNGRREVKDPIAIPVRTVTDSLRRVGDPASGRLSHLGQHLDVLIDFLVWGLQYLAEHAASIGQDVR
jgi:hypothetical protein